MSSATYQCLHTPDSLFGELKAKGFYLYRESFMWGRSGGFRNAAGDCLYVERGEVRTCDEQYRHLLECWQPVARDEVAYFLRMEAAGHLV